VINQSLVEERAPLPCGESCLVVYDSVSYRTVWQIISGAQMNGWASFGLAEVRKGGLWASGDQ